jgi:predicted metal-dependent hydrolase
MELLNIPYKVSYRDIKYPRLEFTSGVLHCILPLGQKPEYLLHKHKEWILKKKNFINTCLKENNNRKLSTRTFKDFKELIQSLVKRTCKEMHLKIKGIYFRQMKTKWASLSPKKNLTINKLMKYLPDALIEYVIFHEISHLKERRHNDRFWAIISNKFENYQEMEKQMFIYWFAIHKKYSLVSCIIIL